MTDLGRMEESNADIAWPWQAVGVLPADNPYPWRGNAFTNDSSVKLGFPDLSGGWMTGGVAGAFDCIFHMGAMHFYLPCAHIYCGWHRLSGTQ